MKKLLKKIGLFFKKLFAGEYELLKKYSGVAVKITQMLKTAVESDFSRIAVNLIPGNLDNELLYKVQKVIPKVAAEVAIAHGIIQASNTNADVVGAILEHLKKQTKDQRVGFWIEFSARLNAGFADGKLTYAESVILAQLIYIEFYQKP